MSTMFGTWPRRASLVGILLVALVGLATRLAAAESADRVAPRFIGELEENPYDEIGLAKSLFADVGDYMSSVKEMLLVGNSGGELELWLLSDLGEARLSSTGEILVGRRIRDFCSARSNPFWSWRFADLDGDGAPERVGWSRCGLAAYDLFGEHLWSYEADSGGPNVISVGDLNGDGKDEVVVYIDAENELAMFGNGPDPLWRVSVGPSSIAELYVVDWDGDGVVEVVGDDLGMLRSWNEHGQETTPRLQIASLEEYLENLIYSGARFVTWPPGSLQQYPSGCSSEEISPDSKWRIRGADGKIVALLPAPFCGSWGGPTGMILHDSDGGVLLAAVSNHSKERQGLLYVWDSAGNLVFMELLEERCHAGIVISEPEFERLLLGCGDKVWAYRLGTGMPAEMSAPVPTP